MTKMGIDISDEVAAELRDFTLKKYGKFRGQSRVVEDALRDYFAKNRAEQGNREAPCPA